MGVMSKLSWRARYVLSGLRYYPRSLFDKDFWRIVFSTYEKYKHLPFSFQSIMRPLVDKLVKYFFSSSGFFEFPIDYYGQRFTLRILSNNEDMHFTMALLFPDLVSPYLESKSRELIEPELKTILDHSFPGTIWEFLGSEFFRPQCEGQNLRRNNLKRFSLEFFNMYFFPKIKQQFWLNEGRYDKKESRIRQGEVVLDAGAHIGMFTCLAGLIVGNEGKVYSFEPSREFAEILQKNVELNGLNNVVIVQKALGDQERLASMDGILVTNDEGDVQVTTLDRFVQENGIDRINFLKMDVEGYERKVLLGGMESLKKFKPRMGICIYHLPDDPSVLKDLILKINPDYHIEYNETGKKFIVY